MNRGGQGDGRGRAGAPDVSVPVNEEESNPQLTNNLDDIESNSLTDSNESGSGVSSQHQVSKGNDDDSSNNEDESVRR